MRTPVEVQIWRLSVLFLAGMSVSVLFRVYTAFRGAIEPKRLSRHVMDMFFAASVLGACAYVVFRVNWGELRLYVAISLALGFGLSDYLVGELTYAAAYRSFSLAKTGSKWASRKILRPSRLFLAKSVSRAKSWLFPPLPPPSAPPDEPVP